MYLFKRYKLKDYKFSLVALVTLISILGVLVVGSANQSLQGRQAFGVVVGLIIMVIVSLIDYQWVLNLYWILYIVNILLLVAVLLFGVEVNGAQRWLNLGFTRFQPSDLTKIITILFYAKFLMDREHKINQKKTIIQAIALMVPTLILIYKEPNLSNTICLALLFCIIMYLGGLSYRFIGTVLAIILPVAIIFLSIVVQPNQKLLRGYQQDRILAWLEPEKYATETAYKQLN